MDEHPYMRIGGWLLAFVILYCINILTAGSGAIKSVGVVSEMSSYYGDYPGLESFIYFYLAFTFAEIIVGLVFLMQLLSGFAGFLNLFFWKLVFSVICSLSMIVWVHILAGSLGSTPAGFGIRGFIIGTIENGLTLLYFARSVRVRTFMGTDEYLRRCIITRKVASPVDASLTAQPPGPEEGFR